jgi:hypothetical protein
MFGVPFSLNEFPPRSLFGAGCWLVIVRDAMQRLMDITE